MRFWPLKKKSYKTILLSFASLAVLAPPKSNVKNQFITHTIRVSVCQTTLTSQISLSFLFTSHTLALFFLYHHSHRSTWTLSWIVYYNITSGMGMEQGYSNSSGMEMRFDFLSSLNKSRVTCKYIKVRYGDKESKISCPYLAPFLC